MDNEESSPEEVSVLFMPSGLRGQVPVGTTVLQAALSEKPLWLSTAGGGVAWLHLRIDSRPKYYSHRPYRDPGYLDED